MNSGAVQTVAFDNALFSAPDSNQCEPITWSNQWRSGWP